MFDEFYAKNGKIGARAWKGVMIRYGEGHNQFRIYNPDKGTVYERRDVEVHEGRNPTPVGDNGGNPTPVGDNDGQTESESDLDMPQSDLALFPNTLRGEELGHITTPKRRFDHNSPTSYEQPENDDPESGSEGGVAPINIEDDDSIVSDDIDGTQHPPGDTTDGSLPPTQGTPGSDYRPEIGLLSDEDVSEEDLAIEPLNEASPPPEEGPRRSERNTQRPDYAQMHRYGPDASLWACQLGCRQSIGGQSPGRTNDI